MTPKEKRKVRRAFLAVRKDFPPDRVVADPELNTAFIRQCRRIGLKQDESDLNVSLLNLRKGGYLKGISKGKRTSFQEESDYRFASEIAARFLEQREGTTLDRIICDPTLRAEFDQIARQFAPGYSELQYRWAAFNLRKGSRLRPEVVSHAAPSLEVFLFPIRGLDFGRIPATQGLYIVLDPRKALYVGETDNLRKRVEKHLDHSDNKGLARWLWEHGQGELRLEIHVLHPDTPTRVRRARETELIKSRRPVFNVKRPFDK
jgi:site-specific DNA-methyltransferase (adenine-specific)